MKKEAAIALLAKLPEGADVRIMYPVPEPDTPGDLPLRLYDRLLSCTIGLMIAVIVMALVGYIVIQLVSRISLFFAHHFC